MIASRTRHRWGAGAALGVSLFLGAVAAGETHVLRRGELSVEVTIDSPVLAEKFGPRFDRCGVVTRLTFHGREFVHPWGLADEFGLEGEGVLGYGEAAAGGTFLKLGVGELRRTTTAGYFHGEPYPVVRLFPLEVTASAEVVRVRQSGLHPRGDGYVFEKSYRLTEAGELEIAYELRNTGTRAFTVRHYNHNFLRFGGAEDGAAYRVQTAFPVRLEVGRGFEGRADTFQLTAPGGGYVAGQPEAGRNEFSVGAAGARLRVRGDFAPVRFAIWAGEGAFSPEVFGEVTLAPGESSRWHRAYLPAAPP